MVCSTQSIVPHLAVHQVCSLGGIFCSRREITRRKLLHNFVGNDTTIYFPNSLSHLLNAVIGAICDRYNKMWNSFHLGDLRFKLGFNSTIDKKKLTLYGIMKNSQRATNHA
jgi:hypothetical protein